MVSPVKVTSEVPQTIYLKDYQKPDYLVESVDLVFEIKSAEQVVVISKLAMRRGENNGDGKVALVLNGSHLKLREVRLDGAILPATRYQVTDKDLSIADLPQAFEIGTTIEINPKENLALEGVYTAGTVLCTQCEAEGFRRITYFLDRPDVMAKYTVRLTADSKTYPILLSNGNLKEETVLSDGRKTVLFVDPFPKPSYLFALVAGNLNFIRDTFQTKSGRKVSLEISYGRGIEKRW